MDFLPYDRGPESVWKPVISALGCREDCEQYVSSLWDWLEGLGTGISRLDPSTWRSPHWPPAFKGIINCLEVSHQAFVWRIRGNARLIKVGPHTMCMAAPH